MGRGQYHVPPDMMLLLGDIHSLCMLGLSCPICRRWSHSLQSQQQPIFPRAHLISECHIFLIGAETAGDASQDHYTVKVWLEIVSVCNGVSIAVGDFFMSSPRSNRHSWSPCCWWSVCATWAWYQLLRSVKCSMHSIHMVSMILLSCSSSTRYRSKVAHSNTNCRYTE